MRERFLTAVCIPAICIALFLCAAPAAAETGWVTEGVSENTTSALGGKISGDSILYLGGAEGIDQSQNRIYLYSILTGDQKIIGSPSVNMTVTGEDISGEYAVWFETPVVDFTLNETSAAPNRVCLYSLRSGSTNVLDTPDTAEWPKIDGDRILLTDDSGDSCNVTVSLHDIATGTSEAVCELPIIDPAGVCFAGGRIAYLRYDGLYLYSLDTGANTTVFRNVFGNESGADVGDYAMGGDYLIYLRHSVNYAGPEKGISDEPYLYRISTGEAKRLDPRTGDFAESSNISSAEEKNLQISSPFTDGERIGWVYSENSPGSTIVLCDPQTRTVETIPLDGLADRIALDGNRMVWVETHFPSFHGELIYAEEHAGTAETAPASAPGFTAGIGIVALMVALVLLAGRRR
ncbi:hypothetical protein FGU65_07050 [Methanoculleus sp. FWC-SCC1]|uniref:Uncharacterized protein n=1 Tax=Methanoculleus frigidifontis TaxID=2584085 RepID=A0ABT8M9P8_9EURY|nr:hypothetical protein [Methanoculleus sp. FWC-SCC1]MDN7024647.1 hypothetical protein [Methanoculleus sp. FWC-SCC1]